MRTIRQSCGYSFMFACVCVSVLACASYANEWDTCMLLSGTCVFHSSVPQRTRGQYCTGDMICVCAVCDYVSL